MMRILEWLSRRAMGMAGWCYLAMTVLICFDIFARRLLGFSSESTIELNGYLLAIGMSWGLAGTLFERGHVRIDVLLQRMPLKWRALLHLVSLLALAVTVGFFIWGSVSLARDSLAFGATDLSALRTPLVIPQGLWAAGFILLGLAVLAVLARSVSLVLSGQAARMDAELTARNDRDEADETLQALGKAPLKP
ncbi:MAG: TRAP transporter small permease [Alphaproteobacteria bacterium]|nr:TRAP transporter small permease [Alphaproteobacteria bacterium]